MNEDFIRCMSARCEKALIESPEYQGMENELSAKGKEGDIKTFSEFSSRVQSKAEELCYIQGFNDAMQLMLNKNERKGMTC